MPRLETVQSTSANSIALVIAQFEYGTRRQGGAAAIEEDIADAGLPDTVEPTVQALNINASPVIIASIAATSEDGLEAAAEIARTEIVPEIYGASRASPRADLTGGLEEQLRRHPRSRRSSPRAGVSIEPDQSASSRPTT